MNKRFGFLIIFMVLIGNAYSQNPGDLIITEWMANPATLADNTGEYFEIYNTTGSPIDLNGFTIKDDGTNSKVINVSVVVPANGYATLAASASPGFTPDWDWSTVGGSFVLGNADDEIVLCSPTSVEIARVNYTDGDPFGAGKAAELNNINNHVNGVTQTTNYKAATNNYNGDLGSPGTAGGTVPVELISFTAKAILQGAHLKWSTASETENLGFVIERKTDNSDWVEIASYKTNDALLGQGSVEYATDYEYVDSFVEAGVTYGYRLGDVDYSGIVTYHASRSVTVTNTPITGKINQFTVSDAYPNPFNPYTTLKYSIPSNSASVNIQIFDISGKLVKTLVNEKQSVGWYEIQWDGTNQNGLNMSGGTYLVRVKVDSEIKTIKLMLLK